MFQTSSPKLPSPRYGQPALDALEESCFMAATWGMAQGVLW